MHKAIMLVAIGLIGGVAVSAWWPRTSDETASDKSSDNRAQNTERVTESERIAALERAFSEQIETLERELAELRSDFALLSSETGASSATVVALPGDAERADVARTAADASTREQRGLRANTPEGRIEALTEAGFSLARAQEIERRLQEHRVKGMQTRYDAERRGESLDDPSTEQLFDTDALLRSELGDADYERYLEAMGRPTTVDVIDILASSAAEQAGMQPGDQILAYDGQRVFNIEELTRLPLTGDPGEPVIVDVLRDDQPLQLVLPRGPLGIFASTGAPAVQYVPIEEN